MAFNESARNPTPAEVVGSFFGGYFGTVALVAGAATVTIPGISNVFYAEASSQTANAARISATAANAFTITGTGTDIVMWFAIGF